MPCRALVCHSESDGTRKYLGEYLVFSSLFFVVFRSVVCRFRRFWTPILAVTFSKKHVFRCNAVLDFERIMVPIFKGGSLLESNCRMVDSIRPRSCSTLLMLCRLC